MYSLVVRIDTEDLRTSGEEKFEESFLANWGENILCNIILGLMYTRIPEEGHLVPLYTTFWNVKIRNILLFIIKDEQLTHMSYCLCKGTNKIIIYIQVYTINLPHQDF